MSGLFCGWHAGLRHCHDELIAVGCLSHPLLYPAFSVGKRRLSMKEQIHEDHVSQVLSTLDSLIDHEYASDSFASISEPSVGSDEAVSTQCCLGCHRYVERCDGRSWRSASTWCCKPLPRPLCACPNTRPRPSTATLPRATAVHWITSTQQTAQSQLARLAAARRHCAQPLAWPCYPAFKRMATTCQRGQSMDCRPCQSSPPPPTTWLPTM